MNRLVLPLVAVLFLGSFFMLTTARNGEFKPSVAYGDNSFMENVVIEQKRAGLLKWRLTASRALHLNAEDIRLEEVGIILPEKGLVLKTEVALYSLSSKNFEVPGEIKAQSKDYDIAGKKLHWDAAKGALMAESDIKIIGKGFVLEGDDLYASENKATLNKNVKAVFDGR